MLEWYQTWGCHNIQEAFHMEGVFSIKVTSLGANMCLLEEGDERENKTLVEEASNQIGQWFDEIKGWTTEAVDNERLTWTR